MTKSQQVARAQICGVCAHLSLAYLHGSNFVEKGNQDTYIFAEKLLSLKKKALEFIKTVSTYNIGLSEKRHAANQCAFLKQYDAEILKQKDDTKKGMLILTLLSCSVMLAYSTKVGCTDYPVIRMHAEDLHEQFDALMNTYIIPAFPELDDLGTSLYFDLVEKGKGMSKNKRWKK